MSTAPADSTRPPAARTDTTRPPAGGTDTTRPPAGGTDTTRPPAGGTGRAGPGRLVWADAAKGACILLVVLWHVLTKHYLQVRWQLGIPLPAAWGVPGEALLPVRMPVFFAVSGLLAARAVRRPWPELLRGRVATLGYLYVLWLGVHTAWLGTVGPALPTDRARDAGDLLGQLTINPSNLWYLPALALYLVLGRLTLRVPPAAVLAPATVLGVLASTGPFETAGEGNLVGLLQHPVFFLAGLRCGELLARVAATPDRRRTAWAALALAAAAAAAAVLPADVTAALRPLLGAVAVPACAVLAGAATRRPGRATRWLSGLGRRTLPVYVLHMPVLAVADRLLLPALSGASRPVQLAAAVLEPPLLVAAVTLACLGLHRALDRAGARWLFALPARAAFRRRRSAVRTVGPGQEARQEDRDVHG